MYETFQERQEEKFRVWSRLAPICVLTLILLLSVGFAAKDIEKDNAQIKNGKLYKNLSLIDGSGFSDEKLNSKSYRIYKDSAKSEQVMDFYVKNQINPKNIIEDCQNTPYTCDFMIQVVPRGNNIKFSNSIFSGGWKDGDASIQKIFFYQNETYSYDVPTYSTRMTNGTVNETYQNGTLTLQGNRTIEQTDLSSLYADDGQPVDIVIRFARAEIKQVDIFPKLFGKNYTEWSYWGTGGVETTYIAPNGTNMTVHTFNTNGTFVVNNSLCVQALLVGAGAGAGGATDTASGGGSGGGFKENSSICLPPGNYSVIVGSKGLGGQPGDVGVLADGTNGGNSSFANNTARGGGHGAGYKSGLGGGNGSSGGGSSYGRLHGFATGSPLQGYDGGTGNTGTNQPGGGAGGSNSTGADATATTGGKGGTGNTSNISGTQTTYSCGGGGGSYNGGTGGDAGCSCAGAGKWENNGNGNNALPNNRGCGGGGIGGGSGTNEYGGNGSDGVVIISYPTAAPVAETVSASIGPIPAFTNSTIGGYAMIINMNATVNWNLTVNGVLNLSGTTNPVIGANTSLFNATGFQKGSVLNLTTIANFTDASTNTSYANLTISNTAPTITSILIQNNLFRGGTIIQGVATFSDIDADLINLSYSWFKNGANQTALSGTALNLAPGTYQANTTAPAMTPGDIWIFKAQITDGSNSSGLFNSSSATVGNISTASTYNSTLSDLRAVNIIGSSTPNASISDMNATIYWNGVARATTKVLAGGTYSFSSSIIPPLVSADTNVSTIIAYTATDGASLFQFNDTFNQTLVMGGVFICNSSISTPTANITVRDELTNAILNATIIAQSSFSYTNNRVWLNSNTTTNLQLCINPAFENYSGVGNSITVSAPGYTTRTFSVSENFSNSSQLITFLLMNSSAGGYYVFTIVNQFNLPISPAVIQATKFDPITNAYVIVESETTNPDGTATLFLQFNVPHNISVSATDYIPYSFSFTPASITSVRVKMTPVSSFTPAVPNYDHVFQDVSYTLQPVNQFSFNQSFNITYAVSSPSSNLAYWGMVITYSQNGTSLVVFNTNNSASPAGGVMQYTAVQNGTYAVSYFFKSNNYSMFAPGLPVFYTLNPLTGLAYTRSQFRTGQIISGWGFYFLGVFIMMLMGGWIARRSVEGAALVAIVFLWGWTALWPEALIVGGIQAWMATALTTIAVIGAMISKSYL